MSDVIHFARLSEKSSKAGGTDAAPEYTLKNLASGSINTQSVADLGTILQFEAPAPVAAFVAPQSPSEDWSNQELASLYRAQRLLSLTGVSFGVDRGRSDEGDPWFVFFGEDGEVIVHFARIDGLYLLDSTAQSALITAPTLEALVEGFARRNHVLDVSGDLAPDDRKVITLTGTHRASKVLMHPAMALAALIWSVHVFSDGLVLPAAYQGEGGLSDLAVPPLTDVSHQALITALGDKQGTASLSSEFSDLAQDVQLREQMGGPAVTVMGQGGGAPASALMGLGLTTLAMSYGIHLWTVPTLSLPTAEEQKTAIAALLLGAEITGEGNTDVVETRGETLAEATDAAEGETQITLAAIEAAEAEAAPTGEGQELQSLLEVALQVSPLVGDAAAGPVVTGTVVPVEEAALEAEELPEAEAETVTAAETAPVTSVPLPVAPSVVFSVSLTEQEFFDDLSSISVVDVAELGDLTQVIPTVSGLFDDNQELAFGTDDVEVLAPLFPIFDETAYDFVVYLMMKDDGPQRSAFNGEVILFDMGAFSTPEGEIYARTWAFEDGSMISAVGLKSDFDAFGLVA